MKNDNNKGNQKKREMKTSLRLRKIGNSLGVIIPKDLVEYLKASEDDIIEIEIIEVHKKKIR